MDPKRLGNAMLGLSDYTTADVLNQPIRRGGILPLTEYADRTEWDLSSGIPGSIGRALTAPARAYRGEMTEDQMIDEGANLAGWLTLGGYMSPKPANALGAGGGGIKAFHGSPHDFDKFSMDKIGTGEGAQAYGHGLYFAEKEDVARSYRDKLHRDIFHEIYNVAKKDKTAALSLARSMRDAMPVETVMKELDSVVQKLERGETPQPGNMYEVRINADPADFLDWDKPLSQHSAKVREAALSAMERASGGITRNDLKEGVTGADAVRYGGLDDPNAMTKALHEAGIPGIRYLDQMSRGAGEGSSNYVVFDDALIEIMRKYGLLGPVAAGTIAAATNDEGPIY